MTIGALEETAEAFVVTAVLAAGPNEVTTAATVWEKASFDAWWAGESAAHETTTRRGVGGVELGALKRRVHAGHVDHDPPGLPDRALPHGRLDGHRDDRLGRSFYDESYHSLNTGGRYNPSTDTWTATSTGANVPAAREVHTAVWTGTEMIVWGGGFDGRYSTPAAATTHRRTPG